MSLRNVINVFIQNLFLNVLEKSLKKKKEEEGTYLYHWKVIYVAKRVCISQKNYKGPDTDLY